MEEIPEEVQYCVIDSRGGMLAAENEADALDLLDDDWTRFILTTDTKEECCKACNENTYGDNCVVATIEGIILWELFADGTWKTNNDEEKK